MKWQSGMEKRTRMWIEALINPLARDIYLIILYNSDSWCYYDKRPSSVDDCRHLLIMIGTAI